MNLRTMRVATTILGLTLLASCASRVGPRVRTGPFVLPSGSPDRYVEVTPEGFGWSGGEVLASAPATAGEPRGAGIDLQQGYAVIAYDTTTAIYSLSSGTATWLDVTLGAPSAHVGVFEGFATVTSGTTVHVLDLEAERKVESRDLTEWLRSVRLRTLEAATPIADGELCLVASKGGARGGVTLQRVQYGAGEWRMSTRSELEVFTRLDSVALDGQGLFLAGIREDLQMGAGSSRGRLWSNLVVVRADPTDLTHREIVFRELQERTPAVREIVAGKSLVGVLLESGELTAFRVNPKRTASAPVFEDFIPGARSIAWMTEDQLVVRMGTDSKIVDMRDR